MIVEVYRNLHKNQWSLRDPKTGRVVGHRKELHLKDCKLVVRKAGRERVLREGRKNVHAFIRGKLARWIWPLRKNNRVRYNPYKNISFEATGRPIKTAKSVYFTAEGKAYLS